MVYVCHRGVGMAPEELNLPEFVDLTAIMFAKKRYMSNETDEREIDGDTHLTLVAMDDAAGGPNIQMI